MFGEREARSGTVPRGRAALAAGAVLLAALAVGAPAKAAPPLFDWSMRQGFGVEHDARGRLVETAPWAVRRGPWTVALQIAPTLCRAEATYRFSEGGRTLATHSGPGCSFTATFAREGDHRIRLDAVVDERALAQTRTVTVQDLLIVSIGDSVASGEAVPDIAGFRHATWQSTRCHRSARAGPAKAAQRIEEDDAHTSVTFVHLACSGATVPEGLTGPYDGVLRKPFTAPITSQLRWVRRIARTRHIDALLVSIGANDVYFGDIVRACATRRTRNCFDAPLPGDRTRTIRTAVASALRALPASFNAVARDLGASVAPRDVHLVGYFDPTHDAVGAVCRTSLGDISAAELGLAQSLVLAPLNVALRTAAAAHGWDAVMGLDRRFRRHGYCAGSHAWVTTLSGSIARLGGPVRGRLLGTMHPNEPGQREIGDAIAARLETHFYPGLAPPPPAAAPAPRAEAHRSTLVLLGVGAVGGFALALALVGLRRWTRR